MRRPRYCYGFGPRPSRIFLCGEKPGETEIFNNRPFSGKSGEEQNLYLRAHSLSTRKWYLTNVIKHFIGDRSPTPEEITAWESVLLAELSETLPELIIAVGAVASRYFLGDSSLDMIHGMPHRVGAFDSSIRRKLNPIWTDRGLAPPIVIPIFHPALGFRDPDARSLIAWDYRRVADAVVKTLRGEDVEIRRDKFRGRERYMEVDGNGFVDAIRNSFDYDGDDTNEGNEIAIDTEGWAHDPFSLQASWREGEGYFVRVEASNFSRVVSLLQLMADKRRTRFILHNAPHDIPVLAAMGIDLTRARIWDTMYAAYLTRIESYQDDPKGKQRSKQGLKPLAYRHCGMEMRDHDDLTRAIGYARRVEYLDRVLARDDWPHPGRIIEQQHDGRFTVYQPNTVNQIVKKIIADVRAGKVNNKGEPTDIEDRWRKIHAKVRKPVEDVLGPLPHGSVRGVYHSGEKGRLEATRYACLSGESLILTEDGPKKIRQVVRDKYSGRVQSVNGDGKLVLARVNGWYKFSDREPIQWLSVETEFSHSGRWGLMATRYTPDHRLLTHKGWKEIQDLTTSDQIAVGIEALDSTQRQIVIGSVLGDGNLSRHNENGWVQFSMGHCLKQRAYLEWKSSLLWRSPSGTKEVMDIDGRRTTILGKKIKRSRFFFVDFESRPDLIDMREEAYSGDLNEIVVGEWTKSIDALGLSILYQDDGSLVGGRYPRIYTYSMSKDSVTSLASILWDNLGVKVKINSDPSESSFGGNTLTVTSHHCDKFFDLISPYVHPSLRYKLPDRFRGVGFMERPKAVSQGQVWARVRRVFENPPSPGRRGSIKTSFCIDVEDTHNFVTSNHEVAHNCQDSDATLRLKRHLREELKSRNLLKLFGRGMRVLPAYLDMAKTGLFASRSYFEALRDEMWDDMMHIGERISREYMDSEPFNPKSPDQTRVLMKRRGVTAAKLTKKTGKASTDKKSIEHLRYTDPAMGLLQDWREREHNKDAFCEPVLRRVDEEIRKRRGHGREDEDLFRITCQILNTRTATRRLATRNLNFLAIPVRTELGNRIRMGFVAPRGYRYVSADLSQIEFRILADECGDATLIALFNRGDVDVHGQTAAWVFGIEYDATMTKEGKKKYRAPAKTVNYGLVYLQTGFGMADTLRKEGIIWAPRKCEGLIHKVHDLYPGIPRYIERVRRETLETEMSSSRLGMPRYLPGIKSRDKAVSQEALRHAMSQRIQGTASDMAQESMIWLIPEIWQLREEGYDVNWCLWIHDEIMMLAEERVAERVLALLIEGLARRHGMRFRIPIEAEGKIGKTWGELK